jgi:dephospho-CoA kinase
VRGSIVNRQPSHRLPGPLIGLAGGIGSGKSTVALILRELGCLVCNSDELARQALADPVIKATIRRWWGDAVIGPDGEVDRAAVAKIVFASPDERRRLETLTHPWIESRRRAMFAAAPPPPATTAFVIDAPLLFEAGLDRECDAVIFVDASRTTRLRRLAAARGWDAAELDRREQSQMPLDGKKRRADHVVQNEGDLAVLRSQVCRVLDEIVASGTRTRAAPAADHGDPRGRLG